MTSATQTRSGAGSRTPVAERTHPLHRFAGRLHEVLDQVTDGQVTAVWSLSEAELVETLSELQTALPRLTERLLALLAHVEHTDLATTCPPARPPPPPPPGGPSTPAAPDPRPTASSPPPSL